MVGQPSEERGEKRGFLRIGRASERKGRQGKGREGEAREAREGKRGAGAHLAIPLLLLLHALLLGLRGGERGGRRLAPLLPHLLPLRPLRLALEVLALARGRRLVVALLLRRLLGGARLLLQPLLRLLARALLLRREQRRLLRRERLLLLALPLLQLGLLPHALLLPLALEILLRPQLLLVSSALRLGLLAPLPHPPRLLARPAVAVLLRRRALGRRLRHGAGQAVQRLDLLHEALPARLAGLQRLAEQRQRLLCPSLRLLGLLLRSGQQVVERAERRDVGQLDLLGVVAVAELT